MSSPFLNFFTELNYVLFYGTEFFVQNSFDCMSWVVSKTSILIVSKKGGGLCDYTHIREAELQAFQKINIIGREFGSKPTKKQMKNFPKCVKECTNPRRLEEICFHRWTYQVKLSDGLEMKHPGI